MTSAMHGESGYERIERDAYYTPAWCTEALLRHVEFQEPIWEPAAGNGAMSEVLEQSYRVYTSDIHPIVPITLMQDFFTARADPGWTAIVTNPPYNRAEAFIKRALYLTSSVTARPGGKVVMLLRNEYDSASTRQHLFSKCPQFALKLVLTRRPKWFADDKASPRHNFSWFVWDWAHEGPAEIRWDQ